jgi:LEA14-like dessication related protein
MKSLRNWFLVIPLVLLGLLPVGCQTVVERSGMAVVLESVDVGSAGSAVLHLRYRNENIMPIATRAAKHKVSINGVAYGTAVSVKPLALAPNGEGREDATLGLGAAEAVRLRAALSSGSVEYTLDSRIECDTADDVLLILTNTTTGRLEQGAAAH